MEEKFNLGTLDTLVTLYECVISRSAEGAKGYTFVEHSKVYANVDRRVDEQVSIGNLEEGQYINLTLYKIASLTTRWRVKVEGRNYEVTAIDPISRISPLCTLSLHSID